MIKIGVDGDRPDFYAERELQICGADIYRGKDGTMTILLPAHSEYQGDAPGYCHFSVDEPHGNLIHGGLYRFKTYEFMNREGYLDDRRTL